VRPSRAAAPTSRGTTRSRSGSTRHASGPRRIANDVEALLEAEIAGRGAALLPEFVAADALRAGTRVAPLERHRGPPTPIQVV